MKIINHILKRITKYIDNISNSWFEFDQDMQMYYPNYLCFYGTSDYDIFHQYLYQQQHFTHLNMSLFLDRNNEDCICENNDK